MAIKRSDLESLVYRTKRVGQPAYTQKRDITETEKNSANTIISNFLSYVLTKHS